MITLSSLCLSLCLFLPLNLPSSYKLSPISSLLDGEHIWRGLTLCLLSQAPGHSVLNVVHVRLQLSLWWLGSDYSAALPLSLSVFQSLSLRNKSWKLCFDLHPNFTYDHLMLGSLFDSCAYFSFGSESAERRKLTMARIYWAFTMNQESKGLGNLGKMHQVTDWSVVKPTWPPSPCFEALHGTESVERWGQELEGNAQGVQGNWCSEPFRQVQINFCSTRHSWLASTHCSKWRIF